MEHIANENIWTPSYYIQIWPPPHAKLAPCITINLPQRRIFKPNNAQVKSGQNSDIINIVFKCLSLVIVKFEYFQRMDLCGTSF